MKRNSLGRNLSALLSPNEANLILKPATAKETLTILEIQSLQPGKYQPRKDFDDDSLVELANSIKKQGLLQPIVVRKIENDKYEIIAGERRWRACNLANLKEVPVIIKQVDDETALGMALVENLQREDLNILDQARAMHRLTTEFMLTHQQISDLLCKSRTAVSNCLRLLNLSDEVKNMLENGDLDMGHARCLLMLNPEQQYEIAKLIVAKNLSVRETETFITNLKTDKPAREMEEVSAKPIYFQELERLSQHLNAKINVKHKKTGKGTLVIHYDNQQKLHNLLEMFLKSCH